MLDPPPIEGERSEGLARDARSVAQWTMFSRVTGFARAVVIAAVLGPSYLGNIFQATNYLPNILFEFLTGSLLAILLVPALVRHIDGPDRREVSRVADGFLGVLLAVFAAVTVLVIATGPLLVKLLAIEASGNGVAAAQERVGLLFLILLMPQAMLYGLAGVAAAVQNAHGRYALASAAPAFENVGVILTMAIAAIVYGTGTSVQSVTDAEVVVLGLGTTLSVGCHAAAQWWGARRVGVGLVPRAGWRDPEVRGLLRKTLGSLGYAGLNGLRQLGATVVANGVPGGVVAFSLATNFYWLPTKVGARSVYLAQLPTLARLYQRRALRRFREELVVGANRAFFLTVPCAVAYLALAFPLAHAVSFGRFAGPGGVDLLALALEGLALGLLGETGFLLATNAAYAREDVRAPFAGMAVRLGLSGVGMLVTAALLHGKWILLGLAVSVAVGDVASALHLGRRVLRGLPGGAVRFSPALLRAVGAAAIMAGPAYLAWAAVTDWIGGGPDDQLGIGLAALVGAVTYVMVQRWWRSPELAFFAAARRPAPSRAARS